MRLLAKYDYMSYRSERVLKLVPQQAELLKSVEA